MLALVFVAAALARLVSAWHVGHDLSLGELLRGTLARAWPLLAAWFLVHVLEAVSVIGLGVLPARGDDVVPRHRAGDRRRGARAHQGHAPLGAAGSRRFWMVLGLALLSVPRRDPLRVGHRAGADRRCRSSSARTASPGSSRPSIGILTSLITMPVVAGITVLIYLDLRVRTEGLDLELDAIEAFPAADLMGLPAVRAGPRGRPRPRRPDPGRGRATTGRRSRSPNGSSTGSAEQLGKALGEPGRRRRRHGAGLAHPAGRGRRRRLPARALRTRVRSRPSRSRASPR